MAKYGPSTAALILLSAVAAAQVVHPIQVMRAPVLDGRPDPAEWRGALRLEMNRRDQVWQERERGAWGGVEDLSATILVGYDTAHLYLAGEVNDNSTVAQTPLSKWESADAIEVFLNLDLGDDEPGQQPSDYRFNEDDVQVFLMPFNEQRPWGQIGWDPKLERPSVRSGFALTGVRVAFQALGPNRYSFEARLPFHNFFAADRDAPRRIGFALALDDHDEGSSRYQYMTLDGRNPVDDTRNMTLLEFAGPLPLDRAEGGRASLWVRLLRWTGEYAIPLLAVLALGLMFRVFGSMSERRRRLRAIARFAAAVVFVLGLVLPSVALGLREARSERAVAGILDALEVGIPEMERGTLASYVGAQRDAQLVELLRGGSIQRRQYYDYSFLADLAEGFGSGARNYPGEFWSVLPYWIPMSVGQTERFDFQEPLSGRRLLVVIAAPTQAGEFRFDRATPRLRLGVRGPSGDAEQFQDIVFDGLRAPGSALGRDGRELMHELVDITGPIHGLSLGVRAGERIELAGLTLVEDERAQGRPLYLGRASLGGIPTALRGPYPEDTGLELASGERRVPLTNAGEDYEKVWVFYRATHPGNLPDVLVASTQVGEIVLEVRGGTAPTRVVPLQHQRNVLFELSRNNQVKGPPPGSNAAVAYEWKDEIGEQHINLVAEIGLARGEVVEAVTFRVTGHYAIRFRAVVFGRARDAAPADSTQSPLMRTDPRTVRLKEPFRRQLEPGSFAIYRDGDLAATTASGPALAAFPPQLSKSSGRRTLARRDGDARTELGFVSLAGSGWGGSHLGVVVADLEFGAFSRFIHAVGLGLCLFGAPVLLLMLAETLASFASLRLRLLAALSVATIAPLAVLAWMVLRVIEEGHDTQQRQHLNSALAAAKGQLDALQAELGHSAETWLTALVDELQADTTPALDLLRARLIARMASQRPPDWKGGFLRLEVTPSPRALELPPISLFEGDPALRGDDTPFRLEPSIYVVWGVPVLGVRREMEADVGTVSLSVARPIDAGLLAKLAPQDGVVLCDVQGYPLAVAASGVGDARDTNWQSFHPGMMATRRQIVSDLPTGGTPAFRRHDIAGAITTGAYLVLHDLDATPRALLGVGKNAEAASLSLPIGGVPVRSFLAIIAAVLLLFAAALSSVVTDRIIRPIERLERGARALGRGDLDVRVPTAETGGQLAALTTSFNQMAQDLRGRIADLRILNSGMQELTSKLDLRDAVATVVTLFMRHSPAERVRVLTRERDSARARLHGADPIRLDAGSGLVADMLDAVGPFCVPLVDRPAAAALAAALGPEVRVALGLPLVVGGRSRGCVLLLFETTPPPPVNLELLSTLAVQAALAIENARLYRAAVEDPYTGAYVAEFFKRRVVVAIAAAQASGSRVGLLAAHMSDGDRLREVFGADRFERAMELLATALSRAVAARDGTVLGRWSTCDVRMLLPDADAETTERLRVELASTLAGMDFGLPPEWQPAQLATAAASFPEDAASAEFLFGALEQRLEAARRVDTVGSVPTIATEGELVASSPAMQRVLRTLQRVAPTDIPILIEGETGTGKELLTDLAHRWSRRAGRPLVKVHCAALPESLLQSELFGHERGAFTGAEARKLGKFELARGGTIFLDEIGEISLDVQVKLLRVLQQKEIDRVGGVQPVAVDVRVVTATNRNLRELVAKGAFREDLYYRLQGMTIAIPPLRERRDEIPILVERFCKDLQVAGQIPIRGLATDAMDALYQHAWPGNVRELRNVVHRAIVLAAGEWVERGHLDGILGPLVRPLANTSAVSSPADEPPAQIVREPGQVTPSGSAGSSRSLDLASPGDDRLATLVALIRDRGEVSVAECVEVGRVSPRTALRDLNDLIERGEVRRIGIRRGARYRLANDEIAEPSG